VDFKSLQLTPSLFKRDFQNHSSWKVLTFAKCFHQSDSKIRAAHRFQNIFCRESLFEKVYEEIWLQNKIFSSKAHLILKIISKEFWKAKTFQRSWFYKMKIYLKWFLNQTFWFKFQNQNGVQPV
jgi:hypothetical protein